MGLHNITHRVVVRKPLYIMKIFQEASVENNAFCSFSDFQCKSINYNIASKKFSEELLTFRWLTVITDGRIIRTDTIMDVRTTGQSNL